MKKESLKISKPKLLYLRNLIVETAREMEAIAALEETLKWGEPSFLVKKGSTIRDVYSILEPPKALIAIVIEQIDEKEGNT